MLSSCRVLTVPLIAAALLGGSQGDTMTVRTASGPVTGIVTSGVASFKGLPYAAPPIGSLRWRAPRAAVPWREPRLADAYGPSCMQRLPIRGARAGSGADSVSENCLTLNVWTLVKHDHPLPVMVWIHGGGNIEGTSGRTLYDGSHFARDSVVLVSLNYRLGRLGFFAHPALTHEAGADLTANYGLLDQLAALRWVRRNIAAFGGDTNNVTVFGESAGGQDVLALLAATPARGLMQQAIAESPGGGWGDQPTLAEADAQGAEVATKSGLPGATATAAQLRAIPAAALVKLADDDVGPIIDGKLLAEPPLAAFANGRAARVPLIIGTNSDEGSLLASFGLALTALFPQWLDSTTLATIRPLYGTAATDSATFERLIFRDGYFAGPVRWVAQHAASVAPVYLYRFDYVVMPLRARWTGATHGSELPFVFENWPIPLLIPADLAMDHAMHSCWVAFAKTGTPACAGLRDWTPYRATDHRLMLINDHPGMGDDPVAAVLDRLEAALHR